MRRLIVACIVVVAVVTVTSIPTAADARRGGGGWRVAGPDPAWVCGARTKETLEAHALLRHLRVLI
jgi:hypothetical protein